MRRRPVNGRKDELLKQPGADLQDATAGLLPGHAESNATACVGAEQCNCVMSCGAWGRETLSSPAKPTAALHYPSEFGVYPTYPQQFPHNDIAQL